jgi:hypothetical protein
MADPVREQIFDAIVTDLSASTGINKVTRSLTSFWDWQISDFPGVSLIPGESEITRIAVDSTVSTWMDREGRQSLVVRGYVQDMGGEIENKLADLIKAVAVVVETSTTIRANTLDVQYVGNDVTENVENYGICDVKFKIFYHFNHLLP